MNAASCRSCMPIVPELTDFQLLADGDNILYLDNSRILTNRKLQERLVIFSKKAIIGLVTFVLILSVVW